MNKNEIRRLSQPYAIYENAESSKDRKKRDSGGYAGHMQDKVIMNQAAVPAIYKRCNKI
jgi:hypothetical protein